jgi:hypothetical protein
MKKSAVCSSGVGGRPASAARTHFTKSAEMVNKTVHWHSCNHCSIAHNSDPENVPVPEKVQGRKECFERHLKICSYYTPLVKQAVEVKGGFKQASSKSANVPKRQKTLRVYFCGPYSETEKETLEELVLEFQANNNLADQFVEKRSTKRLFNFISKAASDTLPNRKQLGGWVLDKYSQMNMASNFEALKSKQAMRGRVNFLSDGWANIAKAHLLGTIIALFGSALTFWLFKCGDRHDAIAIAMEMEVIMLKIISEGWKMGAVITDNAGQMGW